MTTTSGDAPAKRWPVTRLTGHRPRLVASLAICLIVIVVGVVVIVIFLTGGTGQSGVLSNGGPPGDATDAGIVVNPGQIADFGMFVENTGPNAVTLEGARLVPLPGFRTPVLVRLGVLDEHRDLLTADKGWPIPRGSSRSSGTWAMDPLKGYVVLPWTVLKRRHPRFFSPDMIEYGLIGRKANTDYVSAGLIITYRLDGNTYTQTVYNGGDDCVLNVDVNHRAARDALYSKYCAAIDNRAMNAVSKVAAGG